jgi:hypothetical protein
LLELLDGDEIKAKKIFKIKDDVNKYTFFKRSTDIGITYRPTDLSFSDSMIFSWIKEGLDG